VKKGNVVRFIRIYLAKLVPFELPSIGESLDSTTNSHLADKAEMEHALTEEVSEELYSYVGRYIGWRREDVH